MSESSSTDAARRRSELAAALFSPSTIALIGASDDPAHLTSRPQRVLERHGYPGRIVRTDRAHASIGSGPTGQSPAAIPGGADHALVMVPAPAVARTIVECAAAGIKVATILSAGFAESGPRGRQRQEALTAAARRAGIRLLGPNCLGVVNVQGRMALSANSVFEHERLRAGGIGVISQSGSMLGAIVTRAQERGLGFSRLVSVGNECDLALGEVLHLLVDDADTRVILLFLESIRDAPVIAEAARRAFDAGKPVLAFKPGRSDSGREVAATHTGSIVGTDASASAFFRAHGIVRVEVFEALFETAQMLLGQRPPAARRVGAVTVSGGAAAMVVDRLGVSGIALSPPPAPLIERLAARRIRIGAGPLIDLPMGRADGGAYASVLETLLASNHCDVVLAVQGSDAAYLPDSVRSRILAAKRGSKPLAVFVGPRAEGALALLQEHGVAAFRTPEACADAIRAYCEWRAPERPAHIDPADAAALRRAIDVAGCGRLDEPTAFRLLAAIGIPTAPMRVIASADAPVDLPYPVAAKLVSPDIAHKTDAGAVALDLADPRALRAAIDAMVARVRGLQPQARIEAVLVQPMQPGIAEVMIGFRRDPEVGPIVLVGAGGVLAELCSGELVRLAPLDPRAAAEMIAEAPALAAVRGYRNRPRGDLDAIAHALHRLSLLASDERVLEAEINPLVVRSDGVVAVDALVCLAAAPRCGT